MSHNSYIRKKFLKNQIKEDNNKKSKIGSVSPNSAIKSNSFKKKHKFNINLKECQSSRNMINYKFNINNNSKELNNLKNINQKMNKNIKKNLNYKFSDYNLQTLPTSTNSKIKTSRDKIKKFHKNIKIIYININNFYHFKTTVYNTLNNSKKNMKNYSNSNNANKINSKNIQKINSTTNIKKPLTISTSTNNISKNKIYIKEATCPIAVDNKISKSPFNLELETIRVTKRKRIIYPKKMIYSDYSNKKHINKNSQNSKNYNNLQNSNTISKDKINYLDSLVHTSSNSNNINEEFVNNGLGPSSTINNINAKKEIIIEELSKRKNIILPIKKEYNNRNININGYNINRGSLTSRGSNNISNKKFNKNNDIKEINYYKNNNTIINKNKKENNLKNKIKNPVKIKIIYDVIKNSHIKTNKSLGNRTSKKK